MIELLERQIIKGKIEEGFIGIVGDWAEENGYRRMALALHFCQAQNKRPAYRNKKYPNTSYHHFLWCGISKQVYPEHLPWSLYEKLPTVGLEENGFTFRNRYFPSLTSSLSALGWALEKQ